MDDNFDTGVSQVRKQVVFPSLITLKFGNGEFGSCLQPTFIQIFYIKLISIFNNTML